MLGSAARSRPWPRLPRFDTHEVTNQSPPYVDVDLYASDPPLQDAVAANGGDAEAQALSASDGAGARPRCSIWRARRTRTRPS